MFTCHAILVRLTRLSDTSLIVHWFTVDHGLLKTVAKGARQPRSPFAGKLDLFFSAELGVVRARRGELHVLREISVKDWREGLRRSYDTTLLAGYCCRLLEMAVEPEHPEPDLHDLLRRALDHFAAAPASIKALLHFESELARLLGVAHETRPAADALRDLLGDLPAVRRELLERLSPPGDFS